MRRVLGLLLVGLGVLGPGATPAVADPPAPTVLPSPTGSPGTADNLTVCTGSAATVGNGLTAFLNDLQSVSDASAVGDLVTAESWVRRAGAVLDGIAAQLRVDAASAANTDMRAAVGALAAEFARLGGALTSLGGLSTFDTTRLNELAARMGQLCGSTSPEFATPSPTRYSAPRVPS